MRTAFDCLHSPSLFFGLLAAVLLTAGLMAPQLAFAQEDYVAGSVPEKQASATSAHKAKKATKKKVRTADTGLQYTSIAAIELDKMQAIIQDGATVQFTATLVPDDATKKIKNTQITWSVSNPKIARVSSVGVVEGKKSGTVKVIARASNGKQATATVKVIINKKNMATKVPILTYHRIASDLSKRWYYRGDSLAVSATNFERQMKWLKKHGYTTVSTEQVRDWRVEGAFLPKKSVLITMDDGFYEVYHVAYPILKKYDQKATSFLVGSRIKRKTLAYEPKKKRDRYIGLDVIKKMRKEYPNLEFQSHTYNMHHRASTGDGVATTWSRHAIERDFEKNEKFGFTSIAFPYGHTSSNMQSVLRESKSIGIAFGYIMEWPATRYSPLYKMPRFKVMGNGSLGDFIRIVRTAR